MPTVSSHVLDSVVGNHAAGIRIECWKIECNGSRQQMFDVVANKEGRIKEEFSWADNDSAELELQFHSKAYYEKHHTLSDKTLVDVKNSTNKAPSDVHSYSIPLTSSDQQVVSVVVVRLAVPSAHHAYHIPVMLSPHSYSVWWSA